MSSRLLEYELWKLWTRVHARDLTRSHGDLARLLLARLAWLELRPPVLERALHPFPAPVRTLDVLHLASLALLREHGKEVRLATFDDRMARGPPLLGWRCGRCDGPQGRRFTLARRSRLRPPA